MIHRDYASEHDLMDDLIASHRLPVVEEFFPIDGQHHPAGMERTGGSVRERYLQILKNEQLLDQFIESSTHAQMSSLMSTLERELTRLQNERNTQAFYLLAERERHLRESSENEYPPASGERKQQLSSDEMAIYLENALLEQAENVDEMREKIHDMARKFDEEADRRSDGSSLMMTCEDNTAGNREALGSIIGSLADEMLLPDLFRRAARENIKFKQRNVLSNVHEWIYNRKDGEGADEKLQADDDKKEKALDGDQDRLPEERRVVNGLLDGIIDRAVLQPPAVDTAYSENEVEELPEDEEEMAESDFSALDYEGLGSGEGVQEEEEVEGEGEEEISRMANELIEDILSHVMDISE
uniref:Uncharacterized protein n=1 Tax=Anopheles maculatus TaxID=74869 RepID=A0A182SDX6_9DIPT